LRKIRIIEQKIRNSPMADSLNAATKYVATHRPESLGWGPVEDLGADIVEGLRRIVQGCPPVCALLAHRAVTRRVLRAPLQAMS